MIAKSLYCYADCIDVTFIVVFCLGLITIKGRNIYLLFKIGIFVILKNIELEVYGIPWERQVENLGVILNCNMTSSHK